MKINFIIHSIGMSGGLKVIYKYCELLTLQGYDVYVYVPIIAHNNKRKKNFFKNIYFQYSRTMLNMYRFWIKKYCNNISKTFKVFPVISIRDRYIRDADFTIATAWLTAYDVTRLASSKGKKIYFIQGYEVWDNKKLGEGTYLLPLKKIVISQWLKDILIRKYHINNIHVVHNGIETEKFKNDKKIYKNKNDTIICLMLYHKLDIKGIDDGIAAFERSRKIYPKMKLKMFGMEKGKNIPHYVEFFQNPDQELLKKLYCSADIFIFPSHSEGWGLTVVEAMACKCAIVGTNVGCLLDIGEHRTTAMISQPKDIEKLSNNIIELIESPELMRKISEKGYEKVQNLDWSTSLKKFKEALLHF